MIKGVKEINKYLNKWLRENEFECVAQFGTDFWYDMLNDVIQYAVVIPSEHDDMFRKVCQSCRSDIGDNMEIFILSFFHELGHFETQGIFDESEWDDYDKLCAVINGKADTADEDYWEYFHHPIELEATQWGCDYIMDNAQKVEQWWNGLQPLILNFYKLNNIEDN